jgi:hypothetical protein
VTNDLGLCLKLPQTVIRVVHFSSNRSYSRGGLTFAAGSLRFQPVGNPSRGSEIHPVFLVSVYRFRKLRKALSRMFRKNKNLRLRAIGLSREFVKNRPNIDVSDMAFWATLSS